MDHSKHILYNQEVTPPGNLWNNIEQALDDAGNGQQFPGKLYAAEVTPPAGLWDKISDTLDNEVYHNLADKLQQAAVVPAGHNWEAIAEQLSADPYQEIGKKLYNTAVTPPVAAWQAIAAQLPVAETPVIPVAPKKGIIIPFLRYAAAAVLIGLTVFGAFKVFGPQTKNNNTPELANNQPVNTITPGTVNPVIPDSQVTETDIAVAADNNNSGTAKKNSAYRHAVTGNNNRIYASNSSENTSDRYVAFMTLDGNIVRMSKKMEDMICCVTGAEVTEDCKTQLQKWQEKIADAPIALAPGNFMDIFSLVNTLNEGEL